MRLSLGPRVYELTSRALVAAVVDGPNGVIDGAARAIDDGADVVEVATIDDVVAVHARFDCAISFVCRDPQPDVTAAIAAGASLIDDRRGFLDADLIAAAKNTAAVVLTVAACGAAIDACDHLAATAGHAEAAGISSDRIIIDAGLDAPRPPAERDALLHASTRLASLGRPLMASVDEVPAMAFVVARGARLLRVPATCAVQARRVRDTLAAVWEAQ